MLPRAQYLAHTRTKLVQETRLLESITWDSSVGVLTIDEPSALAVAVQLEEVKPDDIGLVLGDEVNVTSVTDPSVELLNPQPKPKPTPGPKRPGSTRTWRDDALGNPTKQLGCAYEVTPSSAIPGRNKQKLYAVTVKECQELCCGMYSMWCKSFDYHKGKSACDLNDKDAEDVGGCVPLALTLSAPAHISPNPSERHT